MSAGMAAAPSSASRGALGIGVGIEEADGPDVIAMDPVRNTASATTTVSRPANTARTLTVRTASASSRGETRPANPEHGAATRNPDQPSQNGT